MRACSNAIRCAYYLYLLMGHLSVAEGFQSLLEHMAAQSPKDGTPLRPRPPLDMTDPRHIIASVNRKLKESGKTADDAYEALLPFTTEIPSALLHIHALGLAAERHEKNPIGNVSGDIGYHTRSLNFLLEHPQEVDTRAIAASTTWATSAANVHASIRRRLTRHGFISAANLVAAHDAALGIEDYVLNQPTRIKKPVRRNGAESRWDND